MRIVDVPSLDPAQPTKVPRDGWDRPLIVPKAGGKPVGHTRTTTFIDCVEDKSALATWGKRSVLVGVARQPSLIDAAAPLDPTDRDDKRKLDALAERAVEAAGSHEKREKGSHLHELSELVDAGLALPSGLPGADVLDMAAYKLATIDFEMIHVERLVVVNELQTAGTPDRVARYTGPGPTPEISFDNELLITDLKTGSVEYGALKMATQLAVYAHGEFYDHTLFPIEPVDNDPDGKKALAAWKKIVQDPELAASAYEPIGEVNQEWGVIFNLPAGSGECTLYWVNLTIGWKLAKLAKTIRKARSTRGAMLPFQAAMQANAA